MSEIYNGSFVLGDTSATTFSAGPGINVDTNVPGVIRISNDETVLWTNSADATTRNITWPQTLSENIENFKSVRIYYMADGEHESSTNAAPHRFDFDVGAGQKYNVYVYWNPPGSNYLFYRASFFTMSGTIFNCDRNFTLNYPNGDNNTVGYNYVMKVVGYDRISGGN